MKKKKKKNFLRCCLVWWLFLFFLSSLCVPFYVFTRLFSLPDCSSGLRSAKDFFKRGRLMLKGGRCCTGGNSFSNRCGGRVASWVAVLQDNVLSEK